MIHLNGTRDERRDGATLAELLAALGVEPRARGVAVAVDGEVVPRGTGRRAAWPTAPASRR